VKFILFLVALSIIGCSSSWSDGPYEVYWIDGTKSLGYNVGEGAYIKRIEESKEINANSHFISVYACPEKSCAFYYIDRVKDHEFAESTEFVFGPYTKQEFEKLQKELSLPNINEQ
jgi:hypothetical protein